MSTLVGEERRVEQRRRTKSRRLDESGPGVLETISDAFVALDRAWRYTYVNRAAENLIQRRREEVIGRTVWEIFPEFVGTRFESGYRRAMEVGAIVQFEEYYAPLNTWFEDAVYPSPEGISIYTRDITDRKQAEATLAKALAELEQKALNRTEQLLAGNEELERETAKRKQAEEERNQLLRRLMTAQQDERNGISRQLHDQLGQDLIALTLKLGMLKRKYATQSELVEQVVALEAIAIQLSRDVDFLVWELRPAALEELGLLVAISNYVKNWSKHFDVNAELHVSGPDSGWLSTEIENVIYRVTQEALTNIAKHARALHVSVLLEFHSGQVSLIIEDDGVGFDVQQSLGQQPKGVGLIGMRERVTLVSGTVEIESTAGSGTTVAVRIPFEFAEV
jgi:PAS domain S-box-containing protein